MQKIKKWIDNIINDDGETITICHVDNDNVARDTYF